MGRKFVSIHILDSNIEEVLFRLGRCRDDLKNDKSNTEKVDKKLRSNKLSSIMNAMLLFKPKEATFYLTEVNNNVSVFSDYFSSQAIKEQVKNWFIGFDKNILIVDYFDDDFLEMSVFRKYKFQTSFLEGPDLESYGLSQAQFDVEKICEIFKVQTSQVEQAIIPGDIFKTCSNFADLFKLPLTLNTFDAIHSKQYQFEEQTYYLGFTAR